MVSTDEHEYRCPSEPNLGLIIVHPGVPDGFGGVAPGAIWCWSHGGWEGIPDAWHDREQELRAEVVEEWRHVQGADRFAFMSGPLAAWVAKYCEHLGWKVPDKTDRYEMSRFMRDLRERKPVR